VDLPEGVGGGGFATYWPLATGSRARITEAQGGPYSHFTIYPHDAIDLGLASGTELRAGFTGVVARVNRGCQVGARSCGAGYGNYVYLKAADGTCAVLGHMSRIDVDPGQQVPRYALLGLSGDTGNSTGPHLHYDRVDCSTNRSLPWSPLEGGSLAEGATITSANTPEDPEPPAPTPAATTTPEPTAPVASRPVVSDPVVSHPVVIPPPTLSETTGGVTHTWTDPGSAGGSAGPIIAPASTVQIACRLTGFRVADGNTWWYRIASSPWDGAFYASADAFYNNGSTSGSLVGTPLVDTRVPTC
jgi:hypothetical protein